MKIKGQAILEAVEKKNLPIEKVLLKRTLRVKETGEFREELIKIDHRNAQKVFDTNDGYCLMVLQNMGDLHLMLNDHQQRDVHKDYLENIEYDTALACL